MGLSLHSHSNTQWQSTGREQVRWRHQWIRTQTSSLRDCWKWKEIQGLSMLSCERLCMCGGVYVWWCAGVCVCMWVGEEPGVNVLLLYLTRSREFAVGWCALMVQLLYPTSFWWRSWGTPSVLPFPLSCTSPPLYVTHVHTLWREVHAVCYTAAVSVSVSQPRTQDGWEEKVKVHV